MTKKPPHDDELEEEMSSIKAHLDKQDKTLGEILTILRGSVSMGVDGVLHKLKQVETAQNQIISDVAHLQRWQKLMKESKGVITITLSQLFTRILAVIGGLSAIIGIMIGIKTLLER